MFLTLRTWGSWNTYKDLLAQHRSQFKPRRVGHRVGRACDRRRSRPRLDPAGTTDRADAAFQQKYDFLICAVNQVCRSMPASRGRNPIEGVTMENYVAWMKTAYWISTTAVPAISVPAGFPEERLPVGLQIVGRYRDDLNVLKIGHAFRAIDGLRKAKTSE
jgi:Asp-tRNA(Asn)/Glu-tRNA(Gln) amidotransferase A subunit family amidase